MEPHFDSEVLSWYSRADGAPGFTASGALDPIPGDIVGKVQVRKLVSLARGDLHWARPVLLLLSGAELPTVGQPPVTQVRVHRPDVLPDLIAANLLEPCSGRAGAYCGLFTVPKRNGLSRVIFDARPANECLSGHPMRFSTFHLGDLLRCWQEVGGAVSTIDYRHFFYQIPLAPALRKFFVLRTAGAQWQPRVVTMGWKDAPLCAQTITWMAVLHCETAEANLGIRPVFRGEALPQYAVVMGQKATAIGYIFVLLDGVAVMGARRELHGAVMRRIQRNTALFGIAVKELGKGTFAGVTFAMQDGRPAWRAASALAPWTPPVSRREVAQRLGSILWHLRVYEVPLLDKEDLLRIFGRVGASACPWGAPFPLEDGESALLRQEWDAWCSERWEIGRAHV